MTYTTFVAALVNLAPYPSANASAFATDLPNIIDDAELRIYRDLDLLNTNVTSTSTLSTSTRSFNLPTTNGTYVVIDTINVITPSGTLTPDLGTRNPLTPVGRSMLDFLWPSALGSTVPTYFAMVSQNNIVVGPWPDQGYAVEVIGTIRPTPLSTTNVTTLLSVNFPDLLIAAAMVRLAALQKNFGAAVDDPKAGLTWEVHYQTLLKSAEVEEERKKFTSQGWSSKQPTQLATPPRT